MGRRAKKGGWIPIRPFKGHRATLTWMMVSIHQSSCTRFTLETTDFFLQNSREFSSRNIPGLYLEQGNGIQTSQTSDLHPSFLVLPLWPSPHGEKHETLCMRFFRLMLCAMGNEGFRLAVIHTGMLETNQAKLFLAAGYHKMAVSWPTFRGNHWKPQGSHVPKCRHTLAPVGATWLGKCHLGRRRRGWIRGRDGE